MKKIVSISFFILLFIQVQAFAATTGFVSNENAKVELLASYDDNNRLLLGLHFKLQEGWVTYWKDPGDSGFAMQLDYNGSKNISDFELLWPYPEKQKDIFNGIEAESYVYKNEIVFPIIANVENKNEPVHMVLHIDYAACREICIPYSADLQLDVDPGHRDGSALAEINRFMAKIPAYGEAAKGVVDVLSAYFKPAYVLGIKESLLLVHAAFAGGVSQSADIIVLGDANERLLLRNVLPLGKIDGKEQTLFIVEFESVIGNKTLAAESYEVIIQNADSVVAVDFSSSKVVSYEKMDKSSLQALENYRDVVLKESNKGTVENEVFEVNIFIVLLFAVLGGIILNIMPCVLPVLSIKFLSIIKHHEKNVADIRKNFFVTAAGIISTFLLLAVLVIVIRLSGQAVGWGFHFQYPGFLAFLSFVLVLFAVNLWGFFEIRLPVIISNLIPYHWVGEGQLANFLSGALATILATPCTAPFLGVAAAYALARGSFEIVLVFLFMGIGLAMPYFIFSIFPSFVTKLPKPGKWMVWVKYILGFLLLATCFWLLWVISTQSGLKSAQILTVILVAVFIVLIPGVIKNSFLKWLFVTIFFVYALYLPAKYADFAMQEAASELALWQKFEPNKINDYVKDGNVVFVDVTADWCLTCKVNKLLVLSDIEIINLLSSANIIAMQADWTRKDDDIAQFLQENGRFGIPFNAVYGPAAPNGIVLSELLTKAAVKRAIADASGN